MHKVSQLESKRGISVQLDKNKIIEITGKVGTRIGLLLTGVGGICGHMKMRQRQKGSNCFLTANYVGFGETKGLGKLKNVLNGSYRIPEPTSVIENNNTEILGYPSYGVIKNENGIELHAFIVIGEVDNTHYCFHQRGDSGKYEFLTLDEIKQNWQRTRYHEGYGLDTYAAEYNYIKINPSSR